MAQDDQAGEDTSGEDKEAQPVGGLSDEEIGAVAERKAGSARVVHEVIRLQGDDELSRPALSLFLSACAAGVAITTSLLASAFLHLRLPDAELVTALGYPIGFVIVILGNLQLFTENTVTAVLPLATHPTWRNAWRLARLWAIVLAGNLVGTFVVAALIAHQAIVSAEQLDAAVTVSSKLLEHDAVKTLLLGMPAGFLVAAIAWILPNARSSEFWIVTTITYVIAIGGFSHVVAGAAEAWLLFLTGHATLGWAIGGFILPALVGNIIGGTGLLAVLAHGQVRSEIETGGDQ